jgi:4-amino-4-deoxy-L-arabinose transferase-like glycosyltransferase
MKLSSIAESLWGNKAKFSYLFITSIILLLTFLGEREIWTQEHRWADIVSGMFYRDDFLHPYLGENRYYDKPLLSYWLIALVAKVSGTLNGWALRLPSVLAGLLAIWSIYRLGSKLKDKHLGLLAGWLLLTTFYFVFWARTSSADMLNLAGSLFAVAWYFDKRDNTSFFDYAVFFIIIALTCLCKGLVGAIVPLIAVFTDMVLQRSLKQHLRWPLFLSTVPALIIYILPFWASSYFGGESYGQNGLYLVYRENILRYFQPFDHQGAIYTYFIYLPLYLMPWAIFFVPALFAIKSRWKTLSLNSKWIAWTLLLLFLFFTVSGSRRSYYVLPLVPFAILFTADWILSSASALAKRRLWAAGLVTLSFTLLFIAINILPTWYYSQWGVNRFAMVLKKEANKTQPWGTWNVVLLDAESKLNFYLQLPPTTKNYQIRGSERYTQTTASLLQTWPQLKNKPDNTIFITRKLYLPLLQGLFVGYRKVEIPYQSNLPFVKKHDINVPIAFIPNK